MDYRDKVFLAVAENLSFSKAAEELFISQPAVTKHIKELESRLNIALFERKGNKVYLTEAGVVNYSHLKLIRDLYRELEFDIGRLNESYKGVLRIGASSTISQYLIPATIAAFYRRYPEIEVYLFNGNSFEVEQMLLESDIDMALVENRDSQLNIQYTDFFDDEIVLVAGAGSVCSRRKIISLSDLKELPIVLREKGSGTLQVIQRTLLKYNIKLTDLKIIMHLGSTESIKSFLADFDGVALLSEKSIEKELRFRDVVRVGIRDFSMHRKFRVALRPGHYTSSAKLFIDFLHLYNF